MGKMYAISSSEVGVAVKHFFFSSSRQHEETVPFRWKQLAVPALFFAVVIYYQELFLKLYCFGACSPQGALFTLLFTLPPALILGLFCGCAPTAVRGGRRLILCTLGVSIWMAAQTVYYHLFKAFMTLFSLTKMAMVAGAFGGMAMDEVLLNWFPILMLLLPVIPAVLLRKKLIPEPHAPVNRRMGIRWFGLTAFLQACIILITFCCNTGVMSIRYIYTQAASPELEVQNFGMFTQTVLELRRVAFGIEPDHEYSYRKKPLTAPVIWREDTQYTQPSLWNHNVMDIDFSDLIAQEEDEELLALHQYFSTVEPTNKNAWTGYFQGKNLIWIVAEGFSSHVLDPERTPTLYRLANSGFVFENFYTPLWGVSTSDGEYVTTTGLIPKSGVWSYSRSSENYMPFGFGTQFSQLGYRTLAYHDYLYSYYDRDRSHPNMGYEYRGIGNGLDMELTEQFPSDLEMMEKTVPEYVNEEQFMVYYLTVSGHLNYTLEENAMCRRHWDEVKDLPYSEAVRCYLACQMELELAVTSLVEQLEEAGKLDDTVIVLSADHYPYGLTDEEYSELLGHPVDPVFERYESTLILWNNQMAQPQVVEKRCSSLDVMPTLSNLFGLEYDSRLMAGRDIFSDAEELVIFANYSFLNEQGAYNSITDEFLFWEDADSETPQLPSESYIAEQMAQVQNRVAYSAAILDHDYYRKVIYPDLSSEE